MADTAQEQPGPVSGGQDLLTGLGAALHLGSVREEQPELCLQSLEEPFVRKNPLLLYLCRQL